MSKSVGWRADPKPTVAQTMALAPARRGYSLRYRVVTDPLDGMRISAVPSRCTVKVYPPDAGLSEFWLLSLCVIRAVADDVPKLHQRDGVAPTPQWRWLPYQSVRVWLLLEMKGASGQGSAGWCGPWFDPVRIDGPRTNDDIVMYPEQNFAQLGFFSGHHPRAACPIGPLRSAGSDVACDRIVEPHHHGQLGCRAIIPIGITFHRKKYAPKSRRAGATVANIGPTQADLDPCRCLRTIVQASTGIDTNPHHCRSDL